MQKNEGVKNRSNGVEVEASKVYDVKFLHYDTKKIGDPEMEERSTE